MKTRIYDYQRLLSRILTTRSIITGGSILLAGWIFFFRQDMKSAHLFIRSNRKNLTSRERSTEDRVSTERLDVVEQASLESFPASDAPGWRL